MGDPFNSLGHRPRYQAKPTMRDPERVAPLKDGYDFQGRECFAIVFRGRCPRLLCVSPAGIKKEFSNSF